MKNTIKWFGVIVLVAVMVITAVSCSKSGGGSSGGSSGGGGKSLNSAEDLKAYLDKQPANSPDKPIKIAMKLNEPMFPKVKDVINEAGKYVRLDITGSPTTTIPDDAFYYFDKKEGCKSLAGIIIPNSVTIIKEGTFSMCTNLTSLNIPNGVTIIENYAFEGCTSLTNVIIPNSVTKIGNNAFDGCTSLISVKIPDSVTEIWDGVFYQCANLTSVTFQGTTKFFEGPARWSFIGESGLKGEVGTYTRAANGSVWTKK